ncbi:MAG: endolytic transglycosylase MltG [Candidatus Komeilibacteria bacterium]|nr:endolytic transglycosylase MltG [Candidatus Komeilibacteria bacterium]
MRRLFLFCLILVMGSLVWFVAQFRAPEAEGRDVTFEVRPGQDVSTISKNLKDEGLIRSSFAFETYIWFKRLEQKMQAGTYRLSTGDTVLKLTRILSTGADREADRVTLIEGWTLKQYRAYLVDRGMSGSEFDDLTLHPKQWIETYPFIESLPSNVDLEGYLFPDTYAVGSDHALRPLIVKMLDTFDRRVVKGLSDAFARQDNSLHEVITIASILEREVRDTADRKKVADIFYRRLEEGIALQSDATVAYATGSKRSQATLEDLKIDSLYNTYKYRGLPPGPIGNPGLDAIEAALEPTPNEYWYFLTDTDGGVHYAKTFDEHKQNKVKYL